MALILPSDPRKISGHGEKEALYLSILLSRLFSNPSEPSGVQVEPNCTEH